MSDFLITLGKKYHSTQLLALLQQLYAPRVREGWNFDFSWGSLALLREIVTTEENLMMTKGGICGWVGDLVADAPGTLVKTLAARLAMRCSAEPPDDLSLVHDPLFDRLNGAFVIVAAGEAGLHVVTDPLSFTQVFTGEDREGRLVALGTHADLVSALSGTADDMDIVSVAQLLLHGYCTFPNTMHARVKQLQAGALHTLNPTAGPAPRIEHASYWSPPAELRDGSDERELAHTLRESIVGAVADRCRQGPIGVALSGGLDSRLVMAAVPPEQECVGLTLCDALNRETRTARNVATAYGRSWRPLFRSAEYLGDSLVDIARLVGFECEFVDAHLFGFADQINGKVNVLLTGDLFDTLFRAYTVHDFVRQSRLGGILPAGYRKVSFNYARLPPEFDSRVLKHEVIERVVERRSLHEIRMRQERGSMAEWLEIYPFGQWLTAATWVAQRRVLPLRLVGADRRLLDFAFRCPVELKLGSCVYLKAACGIYGEGRHVPCANDGVRPGSGHWSRLIQRAIRKAQDGTARLLERLGRRSPVQHSWHDYQRYWRESRILAQLIEKYEPNLAELDGRLFEGSAMGLLRRESLHWSDGFRLLQLAVWRGLMRHYQQQLRRDARVEA